MFSAVKLSNSLRRSCFWSLEKTVIETANSSLIDSVGCLNALKTFNSNYLQINTVLILPHLDLKC